METHAYGTHEVLHESSSILAIVEKKVEKDDRLQHTVAKQLEMRKKMENPHIGTNPIDAVKLQKYEIKQEEYGFKVTMFY